MTNLSSQIKTADWKNEKHVPVIEAPETVAPDQYFTVRATLGKAVDHPNTTEHHIRWIDLYFTPADTAVPYQLARVEFTAHGEAATGANSGPVYTNHEASVSVKTSKSGRLQAVSYCNIHGVWESSREISVQS